MVVKIVMFGIKKKTNFDYSPWISLNLDFEVKRLCIYTKLYIAFKKGSHNTSQLKQQ